MRLCLSCRKMNQTDQVTYTSCLSFVVYVPLDDPEQFVYYTHFLWNPVIPMPSLLETVFGDFFM